ncbi:translation initiation factor IF-2-like [Prionailurus bengalensis]|uniref:Translation initiation factor IF-2-like isoform X1 n=1 Tax=Acinonyx jubatus TaxID=32536 RepID=A0ABM3P0N1_ACIJB|nr:translation initiation factor IF-2-like [Prionailurus bengalensis]XP_053065232.1 translation initiation factor IF-2-like isoform X1 [Acinonyx jubatus]
MNEKSGAGARPGQSSGRRGGGSWGGEARPAVLAAARRRLRPAGACTPRPMSPGAPDPGRGSPWRERAGRTARESSMGALGSIFSPGAGGCSSPSRPLSSTPGPEPRPAPRTAPGRSQESGRVMPKVTQLGGGNAKRQPPQVQPGPAHCV